MGTQALYNKWRGQTFSDILGQEHITRTLRNQVRAGRIGHAYLFTGMRGTGKTSTARILAKAVNCIGDTDDPPCNECHICRSITTGASLDLIEIDAASNRGIDEIRDLRDKVRFSPQECRYKVYVIDEVHMLTNEAFNALLKTLEEPPPHVIFVLCTTEPHRLPDTILSRCQRFDFRRGSVAMVRKNLEMISQREEIDIAVEALEFIARRATGSFRDAVSLLDQFSTYQSGEITLEFVQSVLGSVPSILVSQLVESAMVGDVPDGLRAINQALEGGAEPREFLREILDQLRALMLIKAGGKETPEYLGREALEEMRRIAETRSFPLGRLVKAIKLYNEASFQLRNAVRPQLPLELALVETALSTDAGSLGGQDDKVAPAPLAKGAPALGIAEQKAAQGRLGTKAQKPVVAVAEKASLVRETPAQMADVGSSGVKTQPQEADSDATKAQSGESTAGPADTQEEGKGGEETPAEELSLEWVQGNWNLLLMKIKPRSHQVRALLNSAYPVSVQGDLVTLGCESGFHREKLAEDTRRNLVEEAFSEVLGKACRIQCVVDSKVGKKPGAQNPRPSGNLFSDSESRKGSRQKLVNHPAVKALEKRGGRVSKVSLYDEDKTGG